MKFILTIPLRSLLLLLLPLFLFSCKEPVPVYFNQLPGTVIDSFPHKVCGTYIGLDDILRKEMTERQSVFPPNPDDLRYVEANTEFETPPDTVKNPLLQFNKLSCEKLLKPIDSLESIAKIKIKVAVMRIIPAGLDFEYMDSTGFRSSIPLFRTDANNKITSYKEDFFLAQKTKDGWELIMIDFHHKNLLSLRLPWFTGYDDKSKDAKAFQASMLKTSKGFKALLSKEGKIIGLTAVMKPEEVIELFKKADTDPINFHRY